MTAFATAREFGMLAMRVRALNAPACTTLPRSTGHRFLGAPPHQLDWRCEFFEVEIQPLAPGQDFPAAADTGSAQAPGFHFTREKPLPAPRVGACFGERQPR